MSQFLQLGEGKRFVSPLAFSSEHHAALLYAHDVDFGFLLKPGVGAPPAAKIVEFRRQSAVCQLPPKPLVANILEDGTHVSGKRLLDGSPRAFRHAPLDRRSVRRYKLEPEAEQIICQPVNRPPSFSRNGLLADNEANALEFLEVVRNFRRRDPGGCGYLAALGVAIGDGANDGIVYRALLQQGEDPLGLGLFQPERVRRGQLVEGRKPPEGGTKGVSGIGVDSDSLFET